MASINCDLYGAPKKIRKLKSEVFERALSSGNYHCGVGLPVHEDSKTSFSEHEGSTTLTGTRTQFRRLVGDGHKIKNLAEFESCFLGLACIRTNHSYCPFLEEHNVS